MNWLANGLICILLLVPLLVTVMAEADKISKWQPQLATAGSSSSSSPWLRKVMNSRPTGYANYLAMLPGIMYQYKFQSLDPSTVADVEIDVLGGACASMACLNIRNLYHHGLLHCPPRPPFPRSPPLPRLRRHPPQPPGSDQPPLEVGYS
ncbi:hypothetical protein CRYUN_Cryun39dG0017000 [Craigia yunnanensis]